MNGLEIFAANVHYPCDAGAFMLAVVWATRFAKLFLDAVHNRLAGLFFFVAFGAFWGTLLCWQDCSPYFIAFKNVDGKYSLAIRIVGGMLGGGLGFLLICCRLNSLKTKELNAAAKD